MGSASRKQLPPKQLAIEGKTSKSSKLVFRKCGEFSIRRPGDLVHPHITGMIALSGNIIVSEFTSECRLTLFDKNGKFLSSVVSRQYVSAITNVGNERFATCGTDRKVRLLVLRGDTIVWEGTSFDVDHIAFGIHFNGTYYSVLHNQDNAITVLDKNGEKVRKIVIIKAFGGVIEFGFDIHMDKVTHAIYVPCLMSDGGVLCVSVEGEPLWFTKLAGLPCGITEINGFPCVADNASRCLYLISKDGENKRKLVDNDFNDAECTLFCFDSSTQKIFFVLGEKSLCLICAYKVEK